jgi:hypothetical protein
MHSGRVQRGPVRGLRPALRQRGLAGSISRTWFLPRQRRYGFLLHPAPTVSWTGAAQAQTRLDSHPDRVMTAHGGRGLLRSMRAPKRNRWRLRDHLLRRILTRGARCLREQCGAHRGERRDGAVPFRRRPGSDAEDLSAGSRSASRSCRGAPSTGNTGRARRAARENSARTSQRATRASRWGPHTAPAPGNPAVLSSSELLR